MSEPNPEKRSDQTPEQIGQLPKQQSQMQTEEVASVTDVAVLANSSTGERTPDEMELPFQEFTKQASVESTERNFQNCDEIADLTVQHSPEAALEQEVRATSEGFAEQPLQMDTKASEQQSKIQEHPESVETAAQEDSLSTELTLEGESKATQETLADQSSQLSNGISEQPPELQPKSESINSPQLPTPATSEAINFEQAAHPIAPSTKWAPLIYGRTYEIDFRFLVIPSDFDEQIKNQVWEFIKISTRSPENLSGKPRWIFLRTTRHCIMGVTCLVRDLLNSQEKDGSEDLTRDRHGRPLYAFVGFVAETPVPFAIPAMDLEIFADPYRKIMPRKWYEKYGGKSQQGVSQALRIAYCKEFKPEEQVRLERTRPEIPFDQLVPKRQNTIVFWNIEDAAKILFSASLANQPIYLCFGNLSQKELLDSRFMSAALEEISSRQEVEKWLQHAASQPHNISNPQSSNQFEQASRSSRPIKPQHQAIESNFNPQYERQETSEEGHSIIENIEKLLSLPMDALQIMQERFEYVLAQIAGMEESELRSYERRLMAALNASADELKLSVAECKDLIGQKRYKEAEEKEREIQRRRDRINSINKILRQVQQRIVHVSRSHISQSGQFDTQHQRDPYIGFKEKEKPTDEHPSEPERDTPKPNDPWQL